jgi:hypothetical protein
VGDISKGEAKILWPSPKKYTKKYAFVHIYYLPNPTWELRVYYVLPLYGGYISV